MRQLKPVKNCGAMLIAIRFLLFIGLGSAWRLDMDTLDNRSAAISHLRELVINSDLKMADYMKEDYHLAKWLAFKDFDVDSAFHAIKENLEWREKENIDTILKENWDDMRRRFPYSMDTVDKEGRPVIYQDFGDFDLSAYLAETGVAGTKRYLRYTAMYSEEAEDLVRRLRAQGKNVTQFSLVSNLADYSTYKHACVQCLWVYEDGCRELAPQILPSVNKITMVNAPLVFKAVFSIFSSLVQNNIVIYGQDRNQWEPMLLELMDKDQIPAKLLANAEPHDKDNSEGWLPWKIEL